METKTCKADYRSLLAATLLAESNARKAFNTLQEKGAVDFEPEVWYYRKNAFGPILEAAVDPTCWYAKVGGSFLFEMLRHGPNDWKVRLVSRII